MPTLGEIIMPLTGSFGSGGYRNSNSGRRSLGDSGAFTGGDVRTLSLDKGDQGAGQLDITGQILQGTVPPLPDGSGVNSIIDAIGPDMVDSSPTIDPPAPVESTGPGGWRPITVNRNRNYNPGQTGVYDWTPRQTAPDPFAAAAATPGYGPNANPNNVALHDALRTKYGYGGDFGGGLFRDWVGTTSQAMQDDISNFVANYTGPGGGAYNPNSGGSSGGGGSSSGGGSTNTPAPAAPAPPPIPTINDFNRFNYYDTFNTGGGNLHAAIDNAFASGPELDQATRDYILNQPIMHDVRRWNVTGSNPMNAAQTVNPVLQQIMFQQALTDYNNQYGG